MKSNNSAFNERTPRGSKFSRRLCGVDLGKSIGNDKTGFVYNFGESVEGGAEHQRHSAKRISLPVI